MDQFSVSRLLTVWESRAAEPVNRRDFLRAQIKGAIWMTAAASGLWLPRTVSAAGDCDIAVVKGKAGPATRAAVDLLGGMKAFVKPGQRVVIKPNMSFPKGQETAVNTDALVVKEVAAMCLEQGAQKVSILDHVMGTPKYCTLEIDAVCDPLKPGMVHAVTDANLFKEVKISDSWFGLSKTDVITEVLKADVIIAVPKAKSHGATGVSLSMKGMMGLIYNRQAMHTMKLHDSIVTLASYLKPKLVVVDATRVLSTNGPGGPGEIIAENKIIASPDMVAADAMTVKQCTWYGRSMEPRQVKHIKIAHKAGAGRMDVENLNVKEITV
ncbi:DUF362 domain-containing protein [Desulfospira joergensenii]|uniref:DUF362 domain-containing protein n=1 Tax=Desulfospira joergensenii TaxID=53329 RepID=UPI0003B6472C|nr:DUF362 domain-containing protein [Desulfospira joergensenii]